MVISPAMSLFDKADVFCKGKQVSREIKGRSASSADNPYEKGARRH